MTAPVEEISQLDRRVLRRGVGLLLELVRTVPAPAAGAIGGSFVFALASVAGAVVLGRVTDQVIVPATEDPVSASGAILAGVAVVVASLTRASGVVARRYFGIMATRRMQMHWFDRLSDHYLDQPLAFFARHPTGELLANADNDAERAAAAMQPLPLSLGAVVLLVFSSINLAVLDPMLLAIGLLLFPALAVMNHAFSSRVLEPSARAQADVGEVSSLAHESFEGALAVKLLGLADHESARMRAAAGTLRQDRLEIGRLRAAFEPAIDALPNLGTIALLGVGAWRVSVGAITTGDLVQAMALFAMLAFPMRVVGFLLEELPRSVVSRERILGVLADDRRPEASPSRSDATRVRLPPGPMSLDVVDVGFGYGDSAVLDGVDFSVLPGEIVALVGATGSGKSTLCTLVAGLTRPARGQVRVGGVDLAVAEPDEVRDAVSLVFQETFLFADSIDANLAMGADLDPETLEWAIDTAQAGFVDELPRGRATTVGERGVTLSGGQRQRVALARALARRPRLLVLDDATSAIDPVVEERILHGLRDGLDTTTVVVAHRLATIRLADRVVFLADGRVADSGTHEDLMRREPRYAALVLAYEVER